MTENLSCGIKIRQLKEFVKTFFESSSASHDFLHTMRVFELAKRIGDEENADMEILKKLNFREEKIKKIIYAVSVHSYAQGKIPDTIEGKILQDADRLDALGAVGIMRTYAYGNRNLYHPTDPFYKTKRKLNDREYALDHFYQKLLELPLLMHTKTGKKIAGERKKFMLKFLEELEKEI